MNGLDCNISGGAVDKGFSCVGSNGNRFTCCPSGWGRIIDHSTGKQYCNPGGYATPIPAQKQDKSGKYKGQWQGGSDTYYGGKPGQGGMR